MAHGRCGRPGDRAPGPAAERHDAGRRGSVGAIAAALARVVLGLAVGVSIAEQAPPEQRGQYVRTFNVTIGLGILSANLVAVAVPVDWSWRWMIGGAALPASAPPLCSFGLPESPRWLVESGDHAGARDVLLSVRPEGYGVDAGIEVIRDVVERESHAPVRGWRGLAQPWVRPAVVAALGIAAFTHLSGIEMMIDYAPTILTGVGSPARSRLRESGRFATGSQPAPVSLRAASS